jgi:hypothetical protein
MRTRTAAVLCAMTVSTANAGEKTKVAVPIHVTAGIGLPAETKSASPAGDLEAARVASCRQVEEVEKRLRAQHGKKKSAWPSEATAELAHVEAACRLASFDALYRRSFQKDIDGSAADLRETLADNDWSTVADTADTAAIVVRVVGRASRKFEGQMMGSTCLGLEITPGAASRPGTFGALVDGAATTAHTFTAEEPYWLLEACRHGMRWRAAANAGEAWLKSMADRYAQAGAAASR